MKVSPPSPTAPTSPEQRPDDEGVPDVAAEDRGVKRRRLQSPMDVVAVNGHRLRKHLCPRYEDEDEDAKSPPSAPRQDPSSNDSAEERTSSPLPPDDTKMDNYRQTSVIDNNSSNSKEDCMTSAIRNAVQQLVTNNDSKITISLSTNSEKIVASEINQDSHKSTIISSSPVEHFYKNETVNENNSSEVSTAFDCPAAVTANDCINNETSNDDCLSQSPLNLTRSQGSSEGGNKSEDDDEGEYDDFEDKNGIDCITNEEESFMNGIGNNLPTPDVPFPWNITSSNYNKQKHHQDDKITAPPPQLLLTSGQLTTGCLQAAQLLIPTPRGIMTQTILAIPINDMVSSAITASTSNQQLLQQQLAYHMSNNTQQKNNNRQQLNNQTSQSSLPHNRYFQHQNTADETTNITCTPDNIHQDNDSYDANFNNNGTFAATEQYNNLQKRKWQSPDLTFRKHHFISPQQKMLHRTKNGENVEKIHAQHSNESSMVQTPTGTIGDCHIYPTNNVSSNIAPVIPAMSPPTLKRNDISNNGGNAEIIQRQTIWPAAIATLDHLNDNSNAHNNEEMQLHHPSHGVNSTPPSSSANINTLKSLVSPSSQLNSNVKQSKEDDSTSTNHSAAAAAAAYNQQNAICTALATHMLCASQLAATQQPMFDNMDNSNAVKKSNHIYNNNNNIKTNNMMGVVNPAALEKWMMEERYYYNNNNNNNKNIPAGQGHHQRYNAAAAAAAVAVELLSGGVPTSSSGGGGVGGSGDSLSCKKRKRRTSFTPHALELLNGHFERNTHPSGSEITGLAHRLGYEREVIRIWFCNKRQALKNTVRTINGSGPTHISSKSHNNINGY